MKWRNAAFAASLAAGGVFSVSSMVEGAKNFDTISEERGQTTPSTENVSMRSGANEADKESSSTIPALWRLGAAVASFAAADQARSRQVRHDERREAELSSGETNPSYGSEPEWQTQTALGKLVLAPVIIEQEPAARDRVNVPA
jgi:hypothetical protein